MTTSAASDRCLPLLHVVKLTHKYDSPKLMQWALDQVAAQCQSPGFNASSTTMELLVDLYTLQLPGLADWAEPFIRRSAASDQIDYVAVLRAAATSKWSALENHLYYCLACKGASHWGALNLSRDESHRLLAGYHNLNETMAALPAVTLSPTFVHGFNCSPHVISRSRDCLDPFQALWRHYCNTPGDGKVATVSTKLEEIEKKFEGLGRTYAPLIIAENGQSTNRLIIPRCVVEISQGIKKYRENSEAITQRCFAPDAGFADRNGPTSFAPTVITN